LRSRFGRAPSSEFYEGEARDEKMWFNSPTLWVGNFAVCVANSI